MLIVTVCRSAVAQLIDVRSVLPLAQLCLVSYCKAMTQKEMVLNAIRELPDNASVREIADRLEFMAAIQSGLDQLDRGEGIPHAEVKRQLASWFTH